MKSRFAISLSLSILTAIGALFCLHTEVWGQVSQTEPTEQNVSQVQSVPASSTAESQGESPTRTPADEQGQTPLVRGEASPVLVQEEPTVKMTLLDAAIIGVVEGITEYLPVSSTGHIILTQRALGIGTDSPEAKEAADAFAVSVQLGAIVAVLGLYFRRVKQGVRGLMGQDPVGLRLSINLIAGIMPALVIGVIFSSTIKHYLFGLWPITFAWFVGGVAILWVSYKRPRVEGTQEVGLTIDELTWRSSLVIGFAQCVAMWPGTSRSLMTIVAGVMVGMSLTAAVEFSFLLGVLTLTAATLKDLKDYGPLMLETYGLATMCVGFLTAFISAVFAIEWLVNYLKKHGMQVFGYYRIALAVVVVILLMLKIIEP